MLLTGFGNGGIMGSLIEEWRVCWMVFREIKKTETGYAISSFCKGDYVC